MALLAAVVALWGAGQTINIMTLGGLTLAIGILVDESTVAIENIHTHLARGKTRARAVLDAVSEVAVPMMLAMLCILAVFVPSFFMVGVGRALFVPLALSVGFAMAASYILALTFVPILYTWIGGDASRRDGARVLRPTPRRVRTPGRRRRASALGRAARVSRRRGASSCTVVGGALGTEIFPSADSGQIQVRLRAPTGTRVERTEAMALKVLDAIAQEVGPENVAASLGFIGSQPSSYPVNTIYLWTSGPHEAVLLVSLKPERTMSTDALQESLRSRIGEIAPGAVVSFEAADLVNQVMSFGSPTPIEVAVTGANLTASRGYADKLKAEMAKVSALRDLQFGQALDYPVRQVQIDRERAGQLGVTVEEVGRSLVAATSSSRFVTPNYWADPEQRHCLSGAGRSAAAHDVVDGRHPERAGHAERCGAAVARRRGDRHAGDGDRRVQPLQPAADDHLDGQRPRRGPRHRIGRGVCRGVSRGRSAGRCHGERARTGRADAANAGRPPLGPWPGDRRDLPVAGGLLPVPEGRAHRDRDDSGRHRRRGAQSVC